MSDEAVERCNSAPVIKWLELNSPQNGSFKPIPVLTPEGANSGFIPGAESGNLRRPGSLRLRRHSSLNRGILQRVRTNSEADERPGEAKVFYVREI